MKSIGGDPRGREVGSGPLMKKGLGIPLKPEKYGGDVMWGWSVGE